MRQLALACVLSALLSGCSDSGFNLYTHCGITGVVFQGHYWKATPPLSDGHGNPPPGWGDPYERGSLTKTDASHVVFRGPRGHVAQFALTPGLSFPTICS